MNRKKRAFLFGLLGILVLLGAAYGLLQNAKTKKEQKPEDTGNTVFTVTTVDTAAIDTIVIENEASGEIRLEKKTEDGTDTWVRAGADIYPVNQNVVSNLLAGVLSNLNAYSALSEPAELSEYGLDSPATLTAYCGDAAVLSIALGDRVPNRDAYYCRINDGEDIYLVPEGYEKYIGITWEELSGTVSTPVVGDVDYLRRITLTGSRYENFTAVYEEENPYDYSGYHMFEWYFNEPFSGRVNADYETQTWYTACEGYLAISYKSIVRYGITDLEKYGLSEPSAVLTVDYEQDGMNGTYSLTLGASDGNGGIYGYFDGIPWIFTFSESVLETKLTFEPFTWSYSGVFWPNTHLLKEITITAADGSWDLQITHEEEKDTAVLNGTCVTEQLTDLATLLLDELTYSAVLKKERKEALGLTGENDDEVLTEAFGQPVLTVTAEPDGELSPTVVCFYDYDENSYVVTNNGAADFLADKRSVDGFVEAIKELQ